MWYASCVIVGCIIAAAAADGCVVRTPHSPHRADACALCARIAFGQCTRQGMRQHLRQQRLWAGLQDTCALWQRKSSRVLVKLGLGVGRTSRTDAGRGDGSAASCGKLCGCECRHWLGWARAHCCKHNLRHTGEVWPHTALRLTLPSRCCELRAAYGCTDAARASLCAGAGARRGRPHGSRTCAGVVGGDRAWPHARAQWPRRATSRQRADDAYLEL